MAIDSGVIELCKYNAKISEDVVGRDKCKRLIESGNKYLH